MGITIKDAPLVEQLSGDEKIPISDGSNEPKTVNIEQIKEFANKDIEIPKKVSELENDSGYATSKEVEDAISKIPTPDVGGQISAALVDYVKKVEGKGLSTHDFTDELKAKLEGITPYDPSELEAEISKLETALNTLVGGNASNAIESFNEIIAFLENVSDTESLSGIIAGINTRIAEVEGKIPTKVSQLENDLGFAKKSEVDASIEDMYRIIGTHNKEVKFFCIEPVTVVVEGVEHHFDAGQVATVFVGDADFEIIPTSNESILSLLGYPRPLKWHDWLEGVDMFDGIVFDMNELDTYKHWIQYYQGEYHVQKAQYSNCVFWSDKPYTHSPFEERTNYTLYYSAQLPLCYSTIPANTYKPFYLAYGVKTDPNWNNPDYLASYAIVSGATQTFSYYGASSIGIFDMGVDIITLPKDCRGLMYHAPAIQYAGVFDAKNTTNFGAKKGSWQDAFGDCYSLQTLYIKNLKTSINVSWSPINNESIEYIVSNAINTSAITISVSPYTWNRLTDEIKSAASAKKITIALLEGNMEDDNRLKVIPTLATKDELATKQEKIEDLDAIREGATRTIPTKTSELTNDSGFLTEHQDISHLATKQELSEKQDVISDLNEIREGASRKIPTKVSELENDEGYLTEHQDLSHLATKDEVSEVDAKATQALNKATEINENFNVLEAVVNSKAGAFYVENETGLFIVFKDEASKSAYLTSGDESGVLGKFALGGASSETVYMMTVNTPKDLYSFTTSSQKMEITAGFTSQVKYTDEEGYIEFKEAALFSVSVIKSGAESVVVSSGNVVKQGETFTFDVKPYVGNGDNTVVITAEGLVSASKGVTAVTVGVTSMALLPMDFKWNTPFVEGQYYALGGMKILGTLDKKLHIKVSGNEYEESYEVNIGTAQYDDVAYNFEGLVHPNATGVYKVELWLEATESGLTSETLTYRIMCIKADEVNTAQLICINDVATEVLNYSESKLFSYAVYNGGASTATPSITIHKDSDIIAESALSVSTSTIHDYVYSFMLNIAESSAQIGVFATFGNEAAAIITLKNEASLAPVAGYSFYMDAATRANGDDSREFFINEATQEKVNASWVDMAWVNGMDGWTTDNEGNKCLLIPAMSSASVDLTPMKNVSTVTIEMLYKVSNVSDFNEDIITLLKDTASSWIGMRIKPTNITLHSQSLFTEDLKQGYNTKDEEMVHLVVTIISNYSGIGNVAMIYVNGVKKCSFEWAKGDTFAHDGTLKLGSQTADLYLYKMRVYGFAFAWQQVMQNYIASIASSEQKALVRRKEDSVLNDANEIDYDKVYGVYNTFVVELPKGAQIPNRKNNPSNDAINGTNLYINIIQDPTCTIQGDWLNIPLEGQGTTAMTYYRWNLRSKTSSAYDKFRITAKKNVASSMHSHKRGATALYNDLNLAIVGANEANGRVAVYQYPVYGFQKIENEDKPGTYYYQFIGLYTIGPDKGDKSTFGYDDERYENTLIHMEGTDHSPRGVGMEYPWEQMVVGLNEQGDAFVGAKGADGTMNEGAWEIGACGDKESVSDMKAYLDVEFAPAYKLDYECTPMIVGLPSGTSIDDVNADIKNFRSQVADNGFSYADCHIYIDGEFDLYYFNIVSQTYVKDGRKIYQGLADYGFSTSELASKATVLDKTKYIRQYRMARHKAEVGNYWLLDDSLFHACFLDLIGATDNEKKNSYPYKFGTLASGSRWRWRQDDLDTIFDVNNQGSADKKYSIMNTDTLNGDMIYKGNTSYHWRCIREYYKDEYKAMMKRIMAKMVELCPNGYGTSQIQKLIGCLRRYFWDYAQDYFTGGAYNQDAKWTYEDTWAIYQNDKSVNAVHPLQQSLGSHYEAEVSWVTLRMLFLASMNEFGAFVDYVDSSEGQVSFRQGGDFTFSLTPAIDMRPAVIQGKNSKKIHADGRILAGESVNISMPTDTSADTMVYIQGADWLSDIGDFSKVQIGSTDKTFSVSSKRAQRIKVGDETASEVTTNIGKLDVGYCPSVVEVEARNVSALSDNVDLSKCPRLRRAYFGGTNVTAITLPDGSKIQEYDLPSSLIRLSLRKLPLLTNEGLTYESLNDLSYLWVEDNTSIEGYDLLRTALAGGSPLNNIRVIGFDKVGDSNDFNFIMQLTNGEYHGIDAEGNADNTGYPIIEGHLHIAGSTSQENIDFLKGKFPALVLTADQIINYFKFADPEVSRIVAQNWGDGTGTSLEQIEAITDIGTKFRGNTLIETFDEFEKFEKVTEIKGYAFENCTSLRSINIGENIQRILYRAMAGCSALYIEDLSLPKLQLVEGAAFDSVSIKRISSLGKIIAMPSTAGRSKTWGNYNTLESVVLPNSLTEIGASAFQNYVALKDVVFPEGITKIDTDAFRDCSALDVVLPESVEYIGGYAFSKTSMGGELHLPNLTYLGGTGWRTFDYCKFTKISSLGKVSIIPNGCFIDNKQLNFVELPDSTTSINTYAFQGCSALETFIVKALTPPTLSNTNALQNTNNCPIYVPDASVEAYKTATNWVTYAPRIQSIFYYLGYIDFVDPAVRDICVANFDTDGDGVVSIEEAAAVTDIGTLFKGNTSIETFDEFKYFENVNLTGNSFNGCKLKRITLPNITTIPYGSFMNSGLISIELPSSVTSVGSQAFQSSHNLVEVVFKGNTPPQINAFLGCNNLKVIKPHGSNESSFKTLNDNLYSYDGKILYAVPFGNDVLETDSVETIYDNAFRAYSGGTTSLNFASVTNIKSDAFNGSKIQKITLSKECSLSNYSFANSSLEVLVANGIKAIPYECFTNSRLTSLVLNFDYIANLSYVASLKNTPIANGTGYIYVPDNLVDSYKTAANWSTYAAQIKGISEMPIAFEDAAVEAICLANWDSDSDGVFTIGDAEAVTDIGTVFQGNTEITSFDEFKYFTGVTEIKDSGFQKCSNLTKLTLSSSITKLGWRCFESIAVSELTIPANVSSYGFQCFYNMPNLKVITFEGDSLPYADKFSSVPNLKELKSVSKQYDTKNGCIYSLDGTKFILSPANIEVVDFTGVLSIETGSFMSVTINSDVVIPQSVTNIGNAFNSSIVKGNVIIKGTPQMGGETFMKSSMNNLILEGDSVCKIGHQNVVFSTSFPIYVKDELVESYKNDAGWGNWSSRIKPLSEYVES